MVERRFGLSPTAAGSTRFSFVARNATLEGAISGATAMQRQATRSAEHSAARRAGDGAGSVEIRAKTTARVGAAENEFFMFHLRVSAYGDQLRSISMDEENIAPKMVMIIGVMFSSFRPVSLFSLLNLILEKLPHGIV